MAKNARQFKTALSALCDSLTQRYAGRGLYWTPEFNTEILKVIIRVVPVPGLPFSSHPHVAVMPGFPPGYQNAPPGHHHASQGFQNAPWVYQNAPPVYGAAPVYGAPVYATPGYQQVGALPEGAVAINFDDGGSSENASLLGSQQ